MIHVGESIRKYQKDNSIKSVDIANALGWSRGTYSAFLSRPNPTVHTLVKVCNVMGVKVTEVVDFERV
jgi:DNA-binding phage protein